MTSIPGGGLKGRDSDAPLGAAVYLALSGLRPWVGVHPALWAGLRDGRAVGANALSAVGCVAPHDPSSGTALDKVLADGARAVVGGTQDSDNLVENLIANLVDGRARTRADKVLDKVADKVAD